MNRVRLLLLTIPLLLAALACNLGTPPESPTLALPTATIALLFTATFEPTATPTVAPTATSAASGGGTISGCTPRTDWPVYTVQRGDTLSSIAQRANTNAETLRAANCLTSADVIFTGTQLRVPQAPAAPSPVVVSTLLPGCTTPWFFTFNSSVPEANICPGPLYNAGAAGEDFEGGRAYYYAAINGVIGPSVYVIYNDGTWERFDDRYNGNVEQPSDPSIIPPAGRYQPVRAIGKVWRENASVRAKLGWAYAPERDFAGRRQSPTGSTILFIDHGARNTVLRLDDTTGRWSVAGAY